MPVSWEVLATSIVHSFKGFAHECTKSQDDKVRKARSRKGFHLFKRKTTRDFPGSPGDKTPHSQCRGLGLTLIRQLDPTYFN